MDLPKAECVLWCSDGSGPKYTQTLQTEASVSKNFLSSGGGFAHCSRAGAGAHKSPRLCCSASKQEESSKNLPGQLETSWVTMLQKSHLKINRWMIKHMNRPLGRSQKAARLSGCVHACALQWLCGRGCSLLLSCISPFMQNPGHGRVGQPITCCVAQDPCHEQRGNTRAQTPWYQHCESVFSVPSIAPLRVTVGTRWWQLPLGTRICNGPRVSNGDLLGYFSALWGQSEGMQTLINNRSRFWVSYIRWWL